MQQLWKRHAAAMEKVCSSYGKVCSSYGKGMPQLWKMYAAAMEKVCCSYRNGMLQLWMRCVEVTNLGIVGKPYEAGRKLRSDTPSTK